MAYRKRTYKRSYPRGRGVTVIKKTVVTTYTKRPPRRPRRDRW